MKTLIIYYSRTGTTGKLASALAQALSADRMEIRCDRYRPGLLRYLRAGFDSVRGNLPPIDVPPICFREYDQVLLGSPVWTSYPALPLRRFIDLAPDLPSRVGLFLTYGGHSPANKAIAFVEDLLPQPLVASLAIGSDDMKARQISNDIDTFLEQLAGEKVALI